MSGYLTMKEIEVIKDEINRENNYIMELHCQIKATEKRIREKQDLLYKYCLHQKEIDRSYYGERTQYYCSICNQYL